MKPIFLILLVVFALGNFLNGFLLCFGVLEPTPIASGLSAIACGLFMFAMAVDCVRS